MRSSSGSSEANREAMSWLRAGAGRGAEGRGVAQVSTKRGPSGGGKSWCGAGGRTLDEGARRARREEEAQCEQGLSADGREAGGPSARAGAADWRVTWARPGRSPRRTLHVRMAKCVAPVKGSLGGTKPGGKAQHESRRRHKRHGGCKGVESFRFCCADAYTPLMYIFGGGVPLAPALASPHTDESGPALQLLGWVACIRWEAWV